MVVLVKELGKHHINVRMNSLVITSISIFLGIDIHVHLVVLVVVGGNDCDDGGDGSVVVNGDSGCDM